jgi:single-stranded DNA-specific DHH superfamily exonuclease
LNADYIFILDQPEVSEEFFNEVEKHNLPTVWIDHHDIENRTIPEFVNFYNPIYNENNKEKFSEPTTYLCQQVANQKENLWLAVAGCIADHFVPDFYEQFKKDYPELSIQKETKDPFEIFYNSEIGKVSRIIGFGLKDRMSNVIQMMKMIYNSKNPYDVLNESKENKILLKRFQEVDKKFNKFIDKALSQKDKELIFFKYAGEISMSADLANKLSFLFPDKPIIVIYAKGPRANISGRGEKIKDVILQAIKPLENSTGGGHENAVGAQINLNQIEEFHENIKKILSKK